MISDILSSDCGHMIPIDHYCHSILHKKKMAKEKIWIVLNLSAGWLTVLAPTHLRAVGFGLFYDNRNVSQVRDLPSRGH